MRYRELVEVAPSEVEPEYGYWVTHTGDVVPVNFQNHIGRAQSALRKLGYDVDDYYGALELARSLGWVGMAFEDINASADGDESVLNLPYITPTRMTIAATKAVSQLFSRIAQFYKIYGCRIDAARDHPSWFQPKVRNPLAMAKQWILTHSAKLAAPK